MHKQSDIPAHPLRFPADLAQAEGVHCSVDALLLASFVVGRHARVVDLGAGCGVVGLGLLLRKAAESVVAVECDPEQAACARFNAAQWDVPLLVSERDIEEGLPLQPADLVVCNPPWRLLERERAPLCARRRQALYGTTATLELFVQTGAACLRPGGYLDLIVGADRLADALAAMSRARLSPVRVRAVHARSNRPAVFVLLEGRLHATTRLTLEPPLVLHGPVGREYSPEAQAFCPWL